MVQSCIKQISVFVCSGFLAFPGNYLLFDDHCITAHVDCIVLQGLEVSLSKSYEEAMTTAHRFLSVFLSKCVVSTHCFHNLLIIEACYTVRLSIYLGVLLLPF